LLVSHKPSCVADFPWTSAQLEQATEGQKHKAYRPGTTDNHIQQAALFRQFCRHYSFDPISPSEEIICKYIAFLTHRFSSARSVRNYLSGVRFMHKTLALPPPPTDSFPVMTMLRAADLMLRTPPKRMLPITAMLLHRLCQATRRSGRMGLILRVAITFAYFGMLRQSNLAPAHGGDWDITRHTSRGDVTIAPPGLVLNIKWTKSAQTINNTPLVPIPKVQGAITDPVAAYTDLLLMSPTRHPQDPLLLLPTDKGRKIVTITHLRDAFTKLLEQVGLSTSKYSLHSLRRGGATQAFDSGVHHLHVKRHGMWSSDAFWGYITSSAVAQSPVATALAAASTAAANTL
jgi:hypothetical protein